MAYSGTTSPIAVLLALEIGRNRAGILLAMGKRSGLVRLADVAELAGVSMKTVSNVVNNYPHISPQVQARVQEAIDQLGYRPNVTARRLVTGRTGMVALAIPSVDQPYFSEIARQVGQEARRHGIRVLIEETLDSIEAERAVLKDREEGLVDGIIFHPIHMDTLEIARLKPNAPVVLLGESAMPLTTDHVMIQNVDAAREGVELLLSQGRRRIVFLGTVHGDLSGATDFRLQGYQEALLAAGVPLEPELVLSTDGFAMENALDSITAAVEAGLEFDGVMCRDDLFAVGALKGLAGSGLRVPGDVAVLGWDDTAVARYSTPTLTSIAPNKAEIARVALELLRERMDGYAGVGRHRIVEHKIVTRESTL